MQQLCSISVFASDMRLPGLNCEKFGLTTNKAQHFSYPLLIKNEYAQNCVLLLNSPPSKAIIGRLYSKALQEENPELWLSWAYFYTNHLLIVSGRAVNNQNEQRGKK